jgi:SAM-dependent methyltransferase
VTAVDQSGEMLELLARRAAKEGLAIVTRVMDAHSLAFDDDTFDVVASQFGVMLLPDMPRAVREMARVARPNGRVLVHAYGDPHHIEFLGFLVEAVQSVRPDFDGPPSDPPPLEFQLADPARVRKELTAAGLHDVTVETFTERTDFRSGREIWDWIHWSNPIVDAVLHGMLSILPEEEKKVARTMEEMFARRAGSDGVLTLSNPVNIGIGTK